MFAFRCKECGHLHDAKQAAEADHPHACRVCGAGVSFNPRTGFKTVDPKNWEKLCEATPERLAELGLKPEHVEKHVKWPSTKPEGQTPMNQIRVARDGPKAQDKATT